MSDRDPDKEGQPLVLMEEEEIKEEVEETEERVKERKEGEAIEIKEGEGFCKICSHPANPEGLKVGPLYKLGDMQAHMFCLNFSSGLEQNGEDEEGIKGFLVEDIVKEMRRGSRIKCKCCGKKNATTGCCAKKCSKSYHFPCGLKSGWMYQFFGEFNAFCENHRPVQSPSIRREEAGEEKECGVCLHKIEERVSTSVLWTPCCKRWFHRSCIERMAESAGLVFFKCPLCKNQEIFQDEMLKHGVYIPDQDAEWETGDAYADQLQRYNKCDMEPCLCPDGPFRDDVGKDSPWEIFLCQICGHSGSHITCGNLEFGFPLFKCKDCLEFVKNMPMKPTPVFVNVADNDEIQIVKADGSDPVKAMSKELAKNAIFKVKGTTLDVTRETSNAVFNITPFPVFDMDRPVKLGEIKNVELDNETSTDCTVPSHTNAASLDYCSIEDLLDSHSEDEESSPAISNSVPKKSFTEISSSGEKRKLDKSDSQTINGSIKRKKVSDTLVQKPTNKISKDLNIKGKLTKIKTLQIKLPRLPELIMKKGKIVNESECYKTLQLNGKRKIFKGKNIEGKNTQKGKKRDIKNVEIIEISSDSDNNDEDNEAETTVNSNSSDSDEDAEMAVKSNGYSSLVERTRSNKPKLSKGRKRHKLSSDSKRIQKKLTPIERDGFSLDNSLNSNGREASPNNTHLNGHSEPNSDDEMNSIHISSGSSNGHRETSPKNDYFDLNGQTVPDSEDGIHSPNNTHSNDSDDERNSYHMSSGSSNGHRETSLKTENSWESFKAQDNSEYPFLLSSDEDDDKPLPFSDSEDDKPRPSSPVEEDATESIIGCVKCVPYKRFPSHGAFERHCDLHHSPSPTRRFFCDEFGKLQKLAIKTSIDGITSLENISEDKKKRLSGRAKPSVDYGETFLCDYQCGFSTKVLVTMSNHVKRQHGSIDNAEFPCHQCEEILISPKQLKKHQQIHKIKAVDCNSNKTNNVLKLNCYKCSFVTMSRIELGKHIANHT